MTTASEGVRAFRQCREAMKPLGQGPQAVVLAALISCWMSGFDASQHPEIIGKLLALVIDALEETGGKQDERKPLH